MAANIKPVVTEVQGGPMKAIQALVTAGFTTIGVTDSQGNRYQLGFGKGAFFFGDGIGACNVTLISGPKPLLSRMQRDHVTTVTLRQAPARLRARGGIKSLTEKGVVNWSGYLDLGDVWRTFTISKVSVKQPEGHGEQYVVYVPL